MTHRYVPILFAAIAINVTATAGPTVLAVAPAPQSMSAGLLTEITVLVDSALDASTVNSATIMILGRWSGIAQGTFSLESDGRLVRFVSSDSFSSGEWVTVSISKGLRGENGDALEKGYAWSFWIASSPGSLDLMELERIPVRQIGEGHIQTYGANAADLNNDGYTDLTVPNELSDDIRVFLNDGSGGYGDFTIHPIPDGNSASTNEAVDLNGDAMLDFVVGTE